MLNLYAQSFMTATRTNTTLVRDVTPTPKSNKRRWLSKLRGKAARKTYVDLDNL